LIDRKLYIEKLEKRFKSKVDISTEDIVKFYRKIDNSVLHATIASRINKLTTIEKLHRISRGRYTLLKPSQTIYKPSLDPSLKKLYIKVKKKFPQTKCLVWSSKWLNEFTANPPSKSFTILEVKWNTIKDVFKYLADNKLNVFLNPTQNTIINNLHKRKTPIVMYTLIGESPTLKIKNIETATLEKILVELISKPEIFSSYQGKELKEIYNNIFDKYIVKPSTINRYAIKRNRKPELLKLIPKARKRYF